jgi:acyl-CoA thioester hydrolase
VADPSSGPAVGGSPGPPPVLYETRVRPEWVDYNGHMSEAYYVLVAGYTTDALLDLIGMGDAFRRRTGHSLYTLEAHITYLREIREGEPIQVTTRVVEVDHKRVHLLHDLRHGQQGHAVATEELVACNVDAATGRSATLLEPVAQNLRDLEASHRLLPADARIGRSVSLHR